MDDRWDDPLLTIDASEQEEFRELIGEALYAMVDLSSTPTFDLYRNAVGDLVVHFVNCLSEAHNANEELFFDLPTDRTLEEYPLEKLRQAAKFCALRGFLDA